MTHLTQGQQYVCAGELIALQTMTNVLNYLKMEKIDIQKVSFVVLKYIYNSLTYSTSLPRSLLWIK